MNVSDPVPGEPALPSWPVPSPPSAFAQRRKRLGRAFASPVLLAAGGPRPRNFPHNPFEFRAESHFLYFVGRPLPEAALLVEGEAATLFVAVADPDDAVWHGPTPSAADLEQELGLPVRPLVELPEAAGIAGASTIAPQDPAARRWLESVLERPVGGGADPAHAGADEQLAEAVVELRLAADEAALAQLRQAAQRTARAHRLGMAATRPGLREARVCAAMEAEIRGAGMGLSYLPIVTVRGNVLHNREHSGLLREGDLLLADVGAETPEGWAADITRTWPVSGRFSPTQRAVYEVVVAALRAATAQATAGVAYGQLHDAAQATMLEGLRELGILRGSLEELRAAEASTPFFPHGVGHLLGLDVHDMEDLGDLAGYGRGRAREPSRSRRFLRLDRVLRPSMVVTIEPGFYQIPELLGSQGVFGERPHLLDRSRLSQFADAVGIRVEDDVVVTTSEPEVLSDAAPRSAQAVEAAMQEARG